jgi:hypothetical protein
MKALFLSVGLVAAVQCGTACIPHVSHTSASTSDQVEYGLITMGHNIGYLIDPRTESCVLVYANAAATRVDCAKLKASVPEAAKYITWLNDQAANTSPLPMPTSD